MAKIIYGGDTETVKGKPNSLQFFSEHDGTDEIIFCNEDTAAKKFLEWCGRRKANTQSVVYIHNLEFDLPELLWGYHAELIGNGGEFDFTVGRWRIKGVYGAPTFCKISDGHKRSIFLVDSFSFFRGSLDAASKLFCPNLPKLRRPRDLGERRFTARDTVFCEYAMRDAEVAFHVGESIEKLHTEFDLQQCVSVADLAARIFRHKFLSYTIPQPTRDVIEFALLSYHGGKNNITVPTGWYQGVTALDISSAYPAAMLELPSFENAKLYRRVVLKNPREVPPLGVYRITGTVAECKWPSLFSHAFKPLAGKVEGIHVHGYELNEALRSGEAKITRAEGTYYDQEKDNGAPALRGFVKDFYKRKESEPDKVQRFMYKLILNSISGKFIQTRKSSKVSYADLDEGTETSAAELVAGGMFHPFIASSITAHTRARIHALEHKYKALHTATDGIFTQAKNAAGDKVKKLGALTVEGRGELLLIRNKLYILYSKGAEMQSRAFKGKRIAKWALHGFQGKVFDLEALVSTGRRKYQVNKPWRLREAMKRKLTVNEFTTREYCLKVGDIPVR